LILRRSLRSLDVPFKEDFSSAFGSFFVFFSFGYRESLRSHSSLYTSFKIKQKRNSKSYEKLLAKTALIIYFFVLQVFCGKTRVRWRTPEQGGKDTVSGWKPVYLTDRSDKVLPQKTPSKLRDLDRFEVSLCFVCRKVYPERLEARISEAAKKLKITQR
jgi:hypothetical protein